MNNDTNEGDWYFNGELFFDYAYDYPLLPNSQTTIVDSTDLWAPLKALSPFTKPIKSSLMVAASLVGT